MVFQLTWPNLLTALRILLVPVFLSVFFSSLPYSSLIASGILGLSGLTDILDGYLARVCRQTTELGRVIDPLADKLTMIAVFSALYFTSLVPSWFSLLIIVRELLIASGALFIFNRTERLIASRSLGKCTTTALYITAMAFILQLDITIFLAGLSVLLVFLSGYDYFRQGVRVYHSG